MAQKARVFSSSRNGKGTSLRRNEGGFAAADPRPLISGFLVRSGEGTLAKVASLQPTRSPLLVHLFVVSASVLFSCLLVAHLIPLLPYSIEQHNVRD